METVYHVQRRSSKGMKGGNNERAKTGKGQSYIRPFHLVS
jgi:hypothetical protein